MTIADEALKLTGRYRVVRPLGTGGMATVFLCEDERLGREVAVKRLHPYTTAEDVAVRFEREAKLGASLNHPNVVSVFDTVRDDDGSLIVMEYVRGETLAERLKAGRLDPDEAMRIVRDVAAALDHAHSNGVLHRDVKPANILLGDDGAVKLADLGIATAENRTRITSSGTVLGTAAYMAPEQVEGGEAEPRTDVYALAAVAFEAFSGCKPRSGATPVEVAHQIATGPPPDLAAAWPDAPPAVAEVLRRGMARRPEDRPATPGELARELEGALRSKGGALRSEGGTRATRVLPAVRAPLATPAARPTAPPPPVPRGSPSRRAGPLGVALVAVALLAAAVVALVALGGDEDGNPPDGAGSGASAQKRRPAERPAEKEPVEQSEAPAEPAPAEPAQGGEEDGAALNAEGFDLMRQGRFDEAIPVLERAVAAFPEGTTDVDYAYALFNLGRSLRLAGRHDEAIPILEQRLQIPNQTEAVQRELDAARRSSTTP